MRGNIKYIITIFSAMTIFFLITCGEGNKKLSLDSPIDTMRLFVEIHNRYNDPYTIDDLNITLADDLIFYPEPDDIGNKTPDGYMIPESWDKDEFLKLTDSMLKNAYSISLTISGYENGYYKNNNTEYDCETDFNLIVFVSPSEDYQAIGKVDFGLKLYDDGNWQICMINDKTISDTQSMDISNLPWHEILLLFK